MTGAEIDPNLCKSSGSDPTFIHKKCGFGWIIVGLFQFYIQQSVHSCINYKIYDVFTFKPFIDVARFGSV